MTLSIRTGIIAVVLLTLGLTAAPARAENILDKASAGDTAVAVPTPATTEIPQAVLVPAIVGAESVFEPFNPLLLPTALVQRPAADYDQWRARMDAATAKRRRGMILTAGGFLGGTLVGNLAFAASGESEGGARTGYYIALAGLGAGTWGVFQWISGHSEVARLRDEGARAGYVSVSPVRGGAVGTVALSF